MVWEDIIVTLESRGSCPSRSVEITLPCTFKVFFTNPARSLMEDLVVFYILPNFGEKYLLSSSPFYFTRSRDTRYSSFMNNRLVGELREGVRR